MPDNKTAPASLQTMPEEYGHWLNELKTRIHNAQQRAVRAVNSEMVLLYWHLGRDILHNQARQGWGAKVIDRLSHDLRSAFPEMKGLSPRNLKYMRAFAESWPDAEIVQGVLAQLPWYHQIALLDKLNSPDERLWYAAKAIENNWSRNVLVMQIETRAIERHGKAISNFAEQVKHEVVAEYALTDNQQPMGIAEYRLVESLPENLQTSLPSIEQIEQELAIKHKAAVKGK